MFPCKFQALGTCTNGDKCEYNHHPSAIEKEKKRLAANPTAAAASQTPAQGAAARVLGATVAASQVTVAKPSAVPE